MSSCQFLTSILPPSANDPCFPQHETVACDSLPASRDGGWLRLEFAAGYPMGFFNSSIPTVSSMFTRSASWDENPPFQRGHLNQWWRRLRKKGDTAGFDGEKKYMKKRNTESREVLGSRGNGITAPTSMLVWDLRTICLILDFLFSERSQFLHYRQVDTETSRVLRTLL